MKLTTSLITGIFSLALVSGAGLAQAKPDLPHPEDLLPHKVIGKAKEKERRFINDYNNDRRDKHARHDRHDHKYDKRHGKRYGHKHYKHHGYHNHDHYYGHNDRYYNGWNHDHHPRYGYWNDHRKYGYRYKHHNGHHYYYNQTGFYFPGLGVIEHGHRHGRHCPEWHLESFVAAAVLGTIFRH